MIPIRKIYGILCFVQLMNAHSTQAMALEQKAFRNVKNKIDISQKPCSIFKTAFSDMPVVTIDGQKETVKFCSWVDDANSIDEYSINSSKLLAKHTHDDIDEVIATDQLGDESFVFCKDGNIYNVSSYQNNNTSPVIAISLEYEEELPVNHEYYGLLWVRNEPEFGKTYIAVYDNTVLVESENSQHTKEIFDAKLGFVSLKGDNLYLIVKNNEKTTLWAKNIYLTQDGKILPARSVAELKTEPNFYAMSINAQGSHMVYAVSDAIKVLDIERDKVIETYSFTCTDAQDGDVEFMDNKRFISISSGQKYINIFKVGIGLLLQIPLNDITIYDHIFTTHENFIVLPIENKENSTAIDFACWKVPGLTALELKEKLWEKLDLEELVDIVCKIQH